MPILADWIMLGIVVLMAVLGLAVGFGRGLKFFTGGIFGIVISVIVCYFLYGIVFSWPFVTDLLGKLCDAIAAAQNPFCDFLLKIRIDAIVLCVAMFIIVQIARIIVVAIVKNVVEINNIVFKVINKILGMVFMLAVTAMLALIAFQIIAWIGGSTSQQVTEGLTGSVFKLDWIFENNPLNMLFEYFSGSGEGALSAVFH